MTLTAAVALAAAAALFLARPLLGGFAGAAGNSTSRPPALLLLAAVPAATLLFYLAAGDPHAPGAYAQLRSVLAERADDSPEQLREVLLERLRARPGDARARVILGRLEMSLGNVPQAAASLERAIADSRKVANDPQVLAELADALGVVQGGRLAGRPAELARQALTLDPRHPMALELAGSAAVEQEDYRAALVYWERLLQVLPPQSPQRPELEAALTRLRRLAELQYPEPRRR
jgi:cytochrome c-type biogenesis protein CcmH